VRKLLPALGRNWRTFSLASCLAAFLAVAAAAHSLNAVPRVSISDSRGLCFYAIAGLIPDYHKWYPLKVASSARPDCPWQSSPRLWDIYGSPQSVELRGWLRGVAESCHSDDVEPDWHYVLELDSAWAVSQGIDLNRLFPVGSILIGIDAGSSSPFGVAAVPLIAVELTGWSRSYPFSATRASEPPTGWRFTGAEGCPETLWPFNPRNTLAGDPPLVGDGSQYVRMVGSLVTDSPHISQAELPTWLCLVHIACRPEDLDRTASIAWGGYDEWNPSHPGRWTELHPPDTIQVLASPPKTEALYGVAIISSNCLIGACAAKGVDTDLFPPSPRPGPGWVASYSKIASVAQRVEENSVVPLGDRIHVRIRVRGEPLLGVPGKYKAFFRVFWTRFQKPGPEPPRPPLKPCEALSRSPELTLRLPCPTALLGFAEPAMALRRLGRAPVETLTGTLWSGRGLLSPLRLPYGWALFGADASPPRTQRARSSWSEASP